MHPSHFARTTPDKPALIMSGSGAVLTYGEMERQVRQTAQWFRSAGLRRGDHIAFQLENQPAIFVIIWAAQRCGLYCTPISIRLKPNEIDYILRDCSAKIFISSIGLAEGAVAVRSCLAAGTLCAMVDGVRDGFVSFEKTIADFPAEQIADPEVGNILFYSSGTTGRQKGVKRPLPNRAFDAATENDDMFRRFYDFTSDIVYLSPAPLYHGAPLYYSLMTQHFGGTAVVMERFDAEAALSLIQKYRVTHSQWVPTMFVRMLKLDKPVRDGFDTSSLRIAVHAAAPCPVDIKRRMIDWWGPILREYYGGTEANGLSFVTAEDWLKKPGTVGRAADCVIHILDENGAELPAGREGTIYFESKSADFVYHNDPQKTRDAYNDKGWSTLGDVGYLDADGFLFLTDRKAHMIISGGVNIYPQETESLLVTHPKVMDVAVIGVPNADFGEEVKAIVQPIDMADAGPALTDELIAFCRANLADVKCPRTIDFVSELPRLPTGKVQKRVLRDPYWADHASRII